MDGGDVDELTGVDEVNWEVLDGEKNAPRGGDVAIALTVDVARMVAGYILGQP